MFSKETYVNRRAALQKQMSDGLLVFLGNVEQPMNFADNCFPFRQDSSFLYYFGIQEPKLAAIIDVASDITTVFGDELDIDALVWMGSQETINAKAERAGVEETRPFDKLFETVKEAKEKGRKIHFLPPYLAENKILLSKLLEQNIDDFEPSVEFIKAVAAQRSIKEDQEIGQMNKAVNISNEMHLMAMRIAKPGVKEYEIFSAMQKIAADQQTDFSYPSIITKDGQTLHNHYRGNTLASGDIVLNDSGAEMPMRYAGDLTRSFPVDKNFTNKQREIYNVVHKSFMDAHEMMKAGVNFKDVHLKAVTSLVEGLIDAGLMKGNAEEAVRNNAHTLFMPTGVGHYIGLDVHDMEDLGEQYVGYTEDDPKDHKTFGWKSLRLGRPLEKGNVVTVEPGFYVIPQLLDMWKEDRKNEAFINYDKIEQYRDFGGIRIEDNYLITEGGFKVLGDGLIHTAEEVENYREEHF